MSDQTTLRRKPPAPGPLAEELRIILATCGYPMSDPAERERACGTLVTADRPDAAIVEWFVSLTLREHAAVEQRTGVPGGDAGQLHAVARNNQHSAFVMVFQFLGYSVEQHPATGVVRVKRAQDGHGPATLAADLRRMIAHLQALDVDEAVDTEKLSS